MAGAGDASAAAAPCFSIFSLDVIYGRGNYIHEMRCGEVGPHLYSRMCCAGTYWMSALIFTVMVQANRRSSVEGGDNSVCVRGSARVEGGVYGEGEGVVMLTDLCQCYG